MSSCLLTPSRSTTLRAAMSIRLYSGRTPRSHSQDKAQRWTLRSVCWRKSLLRAMVLLFRPRSMIWWKTRRVTRNLSATLQHQVNHQRRQRTPSREPSRRNWTSKSSESSGRSIQSRKLINLRKWLANLLLLCYKKDLEPLSSLDHLVILLSIFRTPRSNWNIFLMKSVRSNPFFQAI